MRGHRPPGPRDPALGHLPPGLDRRRRQPGDGARRQGHPARPWPCCRPRRRGPTPRSASPAGVAVELVHNFSLIHDDIIDGDTERHHRPTVWSVFGVGPAIIAGDALETWPTRSCSRRPRPPVRPRPRPLWPSHRGHDRRPGRRHRLREAAQRQRRAVHGHVGGQDRRPARLRGVHRGHPGRRPRRHRRRPARLRPPSRPGLPGRRRPARDLGRPGPDRQAGRQRPAPAQEVHAGGVGPGRRRRRGRRAAGPDRSGRRRRRIRPRWPPSTTDEVSGPPTWSRRAAAGSGRRCGPSPTSTPPSAPSTGSACRPSPTGSWPTSPCSWWSGSREPGRLAASLASTRSCAARAIGPAGHLLGTPAPRGLVEGRARDQRHHGRRGPAAAPLPRHPRRRAWPSAAGRWIRSQQQRRRHLGHLLRRPGGSVDHRRGLRGPAPGRRRRRRRPHGRGGGVGPDPRRHRRPPGSSPGSGWPWSAVGDWDDLPVLPPEIMFLPSWAPLNIYDFGCWARQTIVALTVVMAHRPARPCRSASTSCAGLARPPVAGRRRRPLGRAFAALDRAPAPLRTAPPLVPPQAPRCAGPPCARPSSGSSAARRPTAAGAASSRRSSTRSSPCTCRATRSTTR